ncbi:MAG: SoxR reducing system RseC family protein [Nitrospirota bacterium]
MMEETGTVIKVEGITARVKVQKRGSCEGCAATGVCDPSEGGMEIEALNPLNAKAGQTVKVSIAAQSYLKGTMLIYGLPLMALVAGAITGKVIGEEYFKGFDSDGAAALLGFSAFVLTFIFARSWSKKAETRKEYKPVIDEIIC